jgi:GPI mannosyltransferase 3
VLGAALLVVALAGLVDLVTWSAPFHSFWTYFRFNVLEGKSAKYGVLPWDAYLTTFGRHWGWGALAVLGLAAAGARRRPAVAACAAVTLVAHSAIGHKEYRFVYPVVLFTVVLASLGLVELARTAAERLRVATGPIAWSAAAAWLALSGWTAARFQSDGAFGFTRPGESMWTQGRGGIEAMARLAEDPTVCGVALAGIHWAWTGGYTYLHRAVPLYIAEDPRHLARLAPAVNAVLVRPPEDVPRLAGFVRDACWTDLCIARRPGPCSPVADTTINGQLARIGD